MWVSQAFALNHELKMCQFLSTKTFKQIDFTYTFERYFSVVTLNNTKGLRLYFRKLHRIKFDTALAMSQNATREAFVHF